MRMSASSISISASSARSGLDDHLGERGVAAVRLVERRQADEPVLAALGLEDPVGVLALDRERRRLEAGLLARARLEQLGLEAAVGGPAEVHAQEHLGPVLRVGAARVGLDRDDRVAAVVLAGEERVLLEAFELGLERDERGLDLGGHVAVHGEELLRVVVLAARGARSARAACCDARVLGARSAAAALLVVPEAGLAHLLLELGGARL